MDPAPPPDLEDGPGFGRVVLRGVLAALVDAAIILVTMALLGGLAGVVWSQLVEPAQQIRFERGIGQDEAQLSRVFGADGWYVVVALVTGLVAGLVLGAWRKRDALVTVLLVAAGSILAAYVMREVGPTFGPDDPTAFLENAPVGTRADAPWALSAQVALLAWPVSAITGMLIVLLSGSDDR